MNERWRVGDVGFGAMNGGEGGFGGTVCCRRKSCWAAANLLGAGTLSLSSCWVVSFSFPEMVGREGEVEDLSLIAAETIAYIGC